MPAFCIAMAVTGPAIPPPMISAVRVITVSLSVLAGVGAAALGELVGSVGLAQAGQGGERGEFGGTAPPDDDPAARGCAAQPDRGGPLRCLVVLDPAAAGEAQV